MINHIENLIRGFEAGKMTRRQLIARLGAFMAVFTGTNRAEASEETSTFDVVGLNHIALNVTDIKRSRNFYRKHFGLSVLNESERSCFLSCGEDFVALFKEEQPGLDHYCYSIKDYKPAKAMEKLTALGLKPRRHENRVYFDDPDGITVQVAAHDNRP